MLLRFNNSQKYLVYDYETENVRLTELNRPWQVSYKLATLNETLAEKTSFIRWDDLNISFGAAKHTGFDRYKYESSCVDKKTVFDDFNQYYSDPSTIILFFNGINFDVHIHNIYRSELGLPKDFSYLDRCIDVNGLFKLYKLGITKIDRENWFSDFFKMSNYVKRGFKSNLEFAAQDLGIPVDSSRFHDAGYDVEITYRVFKDLIWKMEI